MQIKSVTEADVKDKVVLVRTDYNVPIEFGKIADNTRILDSIENLKYILEKGAKKVVIVSHIGRPGGVVVEDLKMKIVAEELDRYLGEDVEYISKPVTEVTKKDITACHRKVILLENIRFEFGEEKGEEKLAIKLSKLADMFVLDGFSVAHREHASVTKVAQILPSYGGIGLIKEKQKIDDFLGNIRKPFWGFFGGVKLSDKIPVIKALSTKLDGVVFGSSVAVAFLKRYGFEIGDSVVSEDSNQAVDSFLEFLDKLKINVVYPEDLIVADINKQEIKSVINIDINQVLSGKIKPFSICESSEAVYDVGEKSLEKYRSIIAKTGSIFWNGPFGYVELDNFAKMTELMAKSMVESKAITMVGGGDTVSFVKKYELEDKFKYVSTSGGAMMEYIAFGSLPGLDVLKF